MANPLAGLQDHIKLARDYALEGLYDTSIIFFDGAIAQINKHLTTLDDALVRTKWMNCKKAISEEVESVKQLDAQLKSLKEAPGTRRSSSPPIRSNKSFVFQPLDEYPTSSPAPFDDPDVWAPPRDTPTRRPTRGQSSARKSSQDGAWARGSSRTGTPSRSSKPNGSKGGSVVKSSTASNSSVRKGKPSSSKADSA
ncbi:Katanin p60 ATPase-containing subunit A1 [Zea mays]|nr:Katanin p60 ATPase-containing subunit A1 [Zea mays]